MPIELSASYDECPWAESHNPMLTVIMVNLDRLNVIMVNLNMLNAIMLSVIMLWLVSPC
jgi:hypothetical protein